MHKSFFFILVEKQLSLHFITPPIFRNFSTLGFFFFSFPRRWALSCAREEKKNLNEFIFVRHTFFNETSTNSASRTNRLYSCGRLINNQRKHFQWRQLEFPRSACASSVLYGKSFLNAKKMCRKSRANIFLRKFAHSAQHLLKSNQLTWC